MANSVIGALRIVLGMDSAEFEQGADSVARRAGRLTRDFEQMGARLTDIGQGLTIGLTAPLAALGTTAVQAAMESADASAQVQAALTSMGDAAGRSMAQLEALAETQMGASLYDDDEILRRVTANLLTFGNIAGEQFDRAQQAALDLSARLGTDLQGSAMLLGRALNDPVRGLTALTRSGVSFTNQQRDQIKAMVAAGDAAGAQALMLAELERQFGGAAAAARAADPMAAMRQSFAEFQETIGEKLLPLLPRITDAITRVLDAFGRLSPGMQTFVVGAGLVAAAVGPVLMAVGGLISVMAPLLGALGAIGGTAGVAGAASAGFAGLAAAAAPLVVPLSAVAAAGALIYLNWDKIAPVLRGVWTAAQETLGPPLRELLATLTTTLETLWGGPLGTMVDAAIATLGQFGTATAQFLGAPLVQLLTGAGEVAVRAFNLIAGGLRTVNGLLNGDWRQAWNGAKAVVDLFVPGVLQLAESLVTGIAAAFERLRPTFDWVINAFHRVERAAFNMADKIVFNSWVPDMVDGVIDHFGRLQQGMVDPALDFTARTENAFATMATNVLGSLDRMVGAIKSGGFFDILQAGMGVLQQFGVFNAGGAAGGGFSGGDAAWAAASAVPGFASGGSLRLGGMAGIDRNVLSLNGGPIARVSAGELLTVSPANDRGGAGALNVTVTMDPSTGALGAFVRDQAGQLVAQAAPALVNAGADAAVGRIQKMNARRLA